MPLLTASRGAGRGWSSAELLALVGLAVLDLWVLRGIEQFWMTAAAATAAFLVLVLSYRRSPLRWPASSAPGRAWLETGLVVGPLLLLLAIPLVQQSSGTLLWRLGRQAPNPLWWLATELGEAAAQQFVVLFFVWPRLRQLVGNDRLAMGIAAVLFGALHLPNPLLSVGGAVFSLVLLGLFRRSGRFLPLVLTHALLSMVVAMSLPRTLTWDMRAGVRASERQDRYRFLVRPDVRRVLEVVEAGGYRECRGGSDRTVVEGLYVDLLGRRASAAEIDHWTGHLGRASLPVVAEEMAFSAEAVERWQNLRMRPPDCEIPASIEIGAADARFERWSERDSDRWVAQGSSVVFAATADPGRPYVVEIDARARQLEPVAARLNGVRLGEVLVAQTAGRTYRWSFPGHLLENDVRNRLELLVVDPPSTEHPDPVRGVAVQAVRIVPLPFRGAVYYDDEPFFVEGFSHAEADKRWTDSQLAELVFPLRDPQPGSLWVLELTTGARGEQELQIRINGVVVSELEFSEWRTQRLEVAVDGALLRAGGNRFELHLPRARRSRSDARARGLSFISMRLDEAI